MAKGINQGFEKRKILKITDEQNNYKQVLIETTADQVTLDNKKAGVNSLNLQDAIKELSDIAATGGVTSVNGKTGAVNISSEDINAVSKNEAIAGGTHTKITYDSKGLVTGGTDLTEGDIPDLSNTYISKTLKGVKNGIAELDASGKVPSSQLPAYVDDVLEYETKIGFPQTGEEGKIYVDKATNTTWRWSGIDYVQIKGDLALGETSSTAYAGNKGKVNAENIAILQKKAEGQETAINLLNESNNLHGTEIKANADNIEKIKNGTIQTTATKLNEQKSISLLGDVKGTVSTDFSGKTVEITTSIDNNSIDSLKLSDVVSLGGAKNACSVFNVNSKGQITSAGNLIEFGTLGNNTPSDSLVVGGLFFELEE